MPDPAVPTFGVEEEFLLLDPFTGRSVLAAPDLLALVAGERGYGPGLPLCSRVVQAGAGPTAPLNGSKDPGTTAAVARRSGA